MALHKDVKVGQVWTCRISNRIVEVKVTAEVEGKSKVRGFSSYTTKARWEVTNLATKRTTKVTAAKLRRLVREADGRISAAEAERRLAIIERAQAGDEATVGTDDGPVMDLSDPAACIPHGEEECNLCPDEDDLHADDDSLHFGYEDDTYADCDDEAN